MLKNKSVWWVLGLSLMIFWSRMVTHEANFSPVLALFILAGVMARKNPGWILAPVVALFASDLMIGFYPGWAFTYIPLILLSAAGSMMSTRFRSYVGMGLGAPLVFFAISNLGVWMFSGLYAPTWAGLLNCYEMGILFIRPTLTSTLAVLMVFYGMHFALKKISAKGILERI